MGQCLAGVVAARVFSWDQWTKNCGSDPQNGPKIADRTPKMDQKLRIEKSKMPISLGKMQVFFHHQTPPNLTRGMVGWLGEPEVSPNTPYL